MNYRLAFGSSGGDIGSRRDGSGCKDVGSSHHDV